MRSLKASILSLSLIVAFAAPVAAQTVTFDDVTTNTFGWFNDYRDLMWTNAYVIDPATTYGAVPTDGGGYNTVLASGRYVLGNGTDPLSISGSMFSLYGGVFSAAWRNGLTLNAIGFLNGAELYNRSYTLDWATSQYLDLGMIGVDNVVFTTTGGTVDDFPLWYDRSFAADNLEFGNGADEPRLRAASVDVVPEPMTASLMAIGLLALSAVGVRRKRVTA